MKLDIQVQMLPLCQRELSYSDHGNQLSEKTLLTEQQEEKILFFNLSSMMELLVEDTEPTSLNLNLKFLVPGLLVMLLIPQKP